MATTTSPVSPPLPPPPPPPPLRRQLTARIATANYPTHKDVEKALLTARRAEFSITTTVLRQVASAAVSPSFLVLLGQGAAIAINDDCSRIRRSDHARKFFLEPDLVKRILSMSPEDIPALHGKKLGEICEALRESKEPKKSYSVSCLFSWVMAIQEAEEVLRRFRNHLGSEHIPVSAHCHRRDERHATSPNSPQLRPKTFGSERRHSTGSSGSAKRSKHNHNSNNNNNRNESNMMQVIDRSDVASWRVAQVAEALAVTRVMQTVKGGFPENTVDSSDWRTITTEKDYDTLSSIHRPARFLQLPAAELEKEKQIIRKKMFGWTKNVFRECELEAKAEKQYHRHLLRLCRAVLLDWRLGATITIARRLAIPVPLRIGGHLAGDNNNSNGSNYQGDVIVPIAGVRSPINRKERNQHFLPSLLLSFPADKSPSVSLIRSWRSEMMRFAQSSLRLSHFLEERHRKRWKSADAFFQEWSKYVREEQDKKFGDDAPQAVSLLQDAIHTWRAAKDHTCDTGDLPDEDDDRQLCRSVLVAWGSRTRVSKWQMRVAALKAQMAAEEHPEPKSKENIIIPSRVYNLMAWMWREWVHYAVQHAWNRLRSFHAIVQLRLRRLFLALMTWKRFAKASARIVAERRIKNLLTSAKRRGGEKSSSPVILSFAATASPATFSSLAPPLLSSSSFFVPFSPTPNHHQHSQSVSGIRTFHFSSPLVANDNSNNSSNNIRVKERRNSNNESSSSPMLSFLDARDDDDDDDDDELEEEKVVTPLRIKSNHQLGAIAFNAWKQGVGKEPSNIDCDDDDDDDDEWSFRSEKENDNSSNNNNILVTNSAKSSPLSVYHERLSQSIAEWQAHRREYSENSIDSSKEHSAEKATKKNAKGDLSSSADKFFVRLSFRRLANIIRAWSRVSSHMHWRRMQLRLFVAALERTQLQMCLSRHFFAWNLQVVQAQEIIANLRTRCLRKRLFIQPFRVWARYHRRYVSGKKRMDVISFRKSSRIMTTQLLRWRKVKDDLVRRRHLCAKVLLKHNQLLCAQVLVEWQYRMQETSVQRKIKAQLHFAVRRWKRVISSFPQSRLRTFLLQRRKRELGLIFYGWEGAMLLAGWRRRQVRTVQNKHFKQLISKKFRCWFKRAEAMWLIRHRLTSGKRLETKYHVLMAWRAFCKRAKSNHLWWHDEEELEEKDNSNNNNNENDKSNLESDFVVVDNNKSPKLSTVSAQLSSFLEEDDEKKYHYFLHRESQQQQQQQQSENVEQESESATSTTSAVLPDSHRPFHLPPLLPPRNDEDDLQQRKRRDEPISDVKLIITTHQRRIALQAVQALRKWCHRKAHRRWQLEERARHFMIGGGKKEASWLPISHAEMTDKNNSSIFDSFQHRREESPVRKRLTPVDMSLVADVRVPLRDLSTCSPPRSPQESDEVKLPSSSALLFSTERKEEKKYSSDDDGFEMMTAVTQSKQEEEEQENNRRNRPIFPSPITATFVADSPFVNLPSASPSPLLVDEPTSCNSTALSSPEIIEASSSPVDSRKEKKDLLRAKLQAKRDSRSK